MPQPDPAVLTDDDYDYLDSFLSGLKSEKAMNLEMVDGFFAALLCSPQLVTPSQYLPEVLGGEDAAEKDTFSDDLLEHAHYTRPGNFESQAVPEVLLSGHHREIEKWRLESSVMRTLFKRPDLLQKKALGQQEIEILKKWYRVLKDLI